MSKHHVAWSEDFSVGNEQIDTDHKQFIDAINSLYLAIDEGGDFVAIEGVLCQIAELSTTHFAREERLMDQTNFSLRNKHAAEHSRFLGTLDEIVLSFENRELAMVRTMADSLRDTFLFHVMNFDLLLKKHLTDVGRE